jgi:hypothetical protein
MPATAPAVPRFRRPSVSGRPTADEHDRCDVCPHPVVDHDAIAVRYCRATRNADTGRACACRPAAG